MVDVDMEISPIMTLAEEVRSVIFNLLPQNETVNLRLVCKTWNQEIQNNYEYDIKKLNEDSKNFKSILQLRIKNLEIHKLDITPVLNFDGTSIFKHPNAIQKLVIGEDGEEDQKFGPIPQLNLHLLIGFFSKNIRVLIINLSLKMYNYQFPSDLFFNFKHLKNLRINVDDYEDDRNLHIPGSLLHVLEKSSFPCLKTIGFHFVFLNWSVTAVTKIVGNVLRLISKQGKYLEEIFIDVTALLGIIELPVPLQEKELLRIKQIQTLKRVSLGRLPVFMGMDQFWTEFICSQNQLEEFQIYIFSPIHFSLVQQITQNNSATLKMLTLELNSPPTDPPFDLSVFQNCLGMKALKLKIVGEAMMDLDEPNVVNFHCLPENIHTLELIDLKILSEELLIAFRPDNITGAKGFKKLEQLTLWDCGKQGQVGINAVVFYEIMMTHRPSLTHVDFRGTVHQGTALSTVLSQLQIPDNTDFRLKRESDELVWKEWDDVDDD